MYVMYECMYVCMLLYMACNSSVLPTVLNSGVETVAYRLLHQSIISVHADTYVDVIRQLLKVIVRRFYLGQETAGEVHLGIQTLNL